jgi:hypothetical protein
MLLHITSGNEWLLSLIKISFNNKYLNSVLLYLLLLQYLYSTRSQFNNC